MYVIISFEIQREGGWDRGRRVREGEINERA